MTRTSPTSRRTSKPRIATIRGTHVSKSRSDGGSGSSSSSTPEVNDDKYEAMKQQLDDTNRKLDETIQELNAQKKATSNLLDDYEETTQRLEGTIRELDDEKGFTSDLLGRVEQSEKVQADLIARLEKLERAQRAEGVKFSAVEHGQGEPQAARPSA